MEAIWRTIADFPNYEVSNTGLVRSKRTDHLIRPRKLQNGYLQLGMAKDGKQWFRMVHRLVAAAFIGALPDEMEVNHKDGNKLNNHVENLEYVTHRENVVHAITKLGNPGKKLTLSAVAEIRQRLSQKHSHADIARDYGLSKAMVMHINTNRAWYDRNHSWVDGRRKLTQQCVAAIKTRLSNGERRSSLAFEFSVSTSTIDNIANNKSWKHVKG